MSPLSLKVRVGSLIGTWQRHICVTCFPPRFISGATPSDLLVASIAAEPGSKPGSVMPQTNALPTELYRLGSQPSILISSLSISAMTSTLID